MSSISIYNKKRMLPTLMKIYPEMDAVEIITTKINKLKSAADFRIESDNQVKNLDKNTDIGVHPSQISLSSYCIVKEDSIIITYEKDIEGLYCDNPKRRFDRPSR